jgi:hypothetical protein
MYILISAAISILLIGILWSCISNKIFGHGFIISWPKVSAFIILSAVMIGINFFVSLCFEESSNFPGIIALAVTGLFVPTVIKRLQEGEDNEREKRSRTDSQR